MEKKLVITALMLLLIISVCVLFLPDPVPRESAGPVRQSAGKFEEVCLSD